jgi:hypothetical protein
MKTGLSQKLESKAITNQDLLQKIEQHFDLLPEVLQGISSPKAAVRYGCAKVLIVLSERYPEKLYPYMSTFIELLESKYRILTWNAIAIIANLTKVDKDQKFDAIFDKFYSFLNDEYLVTVANVVGSSARIALAKPYLVQRIAARLLKVNDISLTPHLTAECKRVIIEHTISSFNVFFDKIENKAQVLSFVKAQLSSPRVSLRKEAQCFLKKWG